MYETDSVLPVITLMVNEKSKAKFYIAVISIGYQKDEVQ